LRTRWQALFGDIDVLLCPPMLTPLSDLTAIAFAGHIEQALGGFVAKPNLS
jgi:hypothetical protein